MAMWDCPLFYELGESGIKIAHFLYEKKRAKLTDFKTELGMGVEAIYRSIALLQKFDLIVEIEVKGNLRVFELSQKGRLVAQKIAEANAIMESE